MGAGAVQVNLLVSTALSGYLLDEGSISYIYYADRLNQLPLGLIGIGLGTILLPTVSRLLSTGKYDEAMDTQNRGIELALFLTLPATVAFMVGAEPIIRGLFQHGAFSAHATRNCAEALAAFSLGLPSYVLVKVLTPGFYAREDTRTPVRYAMISVGVNLVGNLVLIPLIHHVGPPLATAISSTVNVAMLYVTLRRRNHFETDRRLRRRVPRLLIAAILMGVALWFLAPLADPWLTGSLVRRGIGLTALVSGGVAVYALACFVTGAYRVSDLKALLGRRRAGPATGQEQV
jgi:putative peptidoglycan lipid II flippase